jgi:Beta-lactamase enzyme family
MWPRGLLALAGLVVSLAAPAPASAAPTWVERVRTAAAWADARQGVVYFAATGENGDLLGRRTERIARSASLLKPMLLVAYLRRDSVRDRALTERERRLLGPMIRRSANGRVPELIRRLGEQAIARLARRAGMRKFELHLPAWGQSEITARDQARFFRRIDSFVPVRHRAYAMRLLASIVRSQRWGIPPVKPEGWRIYFKGGWSDGTGRVTHQVALLRRGEERVSLAVLTQWNPNQAYGERTIRGIARRLLRGL